MVGRHEQNGKAPGFWVRAEMIRASSLSSQQKWLLRCLADYAGDDGNCFVSRERLSVDLSLGERQVSKIVGSLVRLGILSIDLRPHRTNVYRIHWDRLESAHSSSRNYETGNSRSGNCSSPLRGTGVRPTGNCSSPLPGTVVPAEHSLNTHSTQEGTSKRERARFRPEEIELPDGLDTPEFRTAWRQFCEHRRDIKKPLSRQAASLNLNRCAALGVDRAIGGIEYSITGGHPAVYPDWDRNRNGNAQSLPFAGLKRFTEKDQ